MKIHSRRFKLLSIFLSLTLLISTEVLCQRDSSSLAQLIKETNENFLYPFASGILLSPYEIRQHHRDKTLKNIEWINSFNYYRVTHSKTDTIPFTVKDNQTIIQKPEDRFNSRTYSYYKDGRIHKILRGRHLDDLFLNDEEGFLIQHGYGGELKKAKRNKKTFEWYNVNKNKLEYIISFDEKNRLAKTKTMGHYFGPGVEHQTEIYSWQGNQILSKKTILKFKASKADTSFINFTYDKIGLIETIRTRKGEESTWGTTNFETSIEHLEKNQVKINISNKDQLVLSITFDHLDNIVELKSPQTHIKREMEYRKKKRWTLF